MKHLRTNALPHNPDLSCAQPAVLPKPVIDDEGNIYYGRATNGVLPKPVIDDEGNIYYGRATNAPPSNK